ncbi:MAG TPA: plastocyanin/azurin family copper-binding protein [Gemmatimonadota bacterium]|nr:plastocyanin/azurin family copper-binding protein [Gemmatimonadota bacterium]
MTSSPRSNTRFTAFLMASFLVGAAACGGSDGYGIGPGDGGGGGGDGSGGRTTSIDMTTSLTFVPKVDTVTAGQTVTWTTQGSIAHTTTSDSAGLWDSGNVAAGQSFTHTFNDTGSFPYHCTYHGAPGSGMAGTIVVIPQ